MLLEDSGGARARVATGQVLLATGGYASNAALFEKYSGLPGFHRAESSEALARTAGLPAQGLAAAIEGYNCGVDTGHDFLGRPHLPRRISRAPFYALRHPGTSITFGRLLGQGFFA